LTTPRAINGVNFDGSAGITVTAAGSTLSDTVTVAKGGTGATSLTDGHVLLGSGTGAVTALDVTAKGSILVGDGTTDPVALAVGDDDQVLTADSGEASGLKWAAAGGGSGDITSVVAGSGMTGGATSGAATVNVIGGDGITANANDVAITAAQTTITSVLNASLVIGRDADNDIDFTTDNNIRFRAGGEDQLTLVDGALTPTTNAIVDLGTDDLEFKDGYFDGTLEADAITIGGTAIASVLSPVAGHASIATVGTIGTGVWQGTAVASAYLDADTAHLTTAQTFTGSKTMGTTVKLNFRDGNSYINSPTANDLEIVATDIVLDAATSIALENNTSVTGNLTVSGSVTHDYNSSTFENQLADDVGSGKIIKYSPGADDTLVGSQIYFLHTDGTWNLADADGVATGGTQMLGVGLQGSARTVGVFIEGFIRIAATEILNTPASGEVDGLPLYVSTEVGHFDFTAPSGAGDFVRIVGYAIDDDSGSVLVNFSPSKDHIILAS
jgi:hypothetical protein